MINYTATIFTSHYVSINSCMSIDKSDEYKRFTSHYVSINSIRTLI